MALDTAFWTARQTRALARLEAYELAVEAFAANEAQQVYSLDTGQTTIRVERADPAIMDRMIQSALNAYIHACTQLNEAPRSIVVRPTW